eukprot:7316742-Prymnesium_polylepis.1
MLLRLAASAPRPSPDEPQAPPSIPEAQLIKAAAPDVQRQHRTCVPNVAAQERGNRTSVQE